MESCILCFNFINEGDSLPLEQCYSSNIAGFDIIRDLFSFYDRILSIDSESPRTVCKSCWMQCENFHEFYQQVANNYGLLHTLDDGDVKVKLEDGVVDTVWEDCQADDTIVEEYEEVKPDNFEDYFPYQSDYSPPPKKKKKQTPRRPSGEPSTRPPHLVIDPADDDKIRQFANMNCELCSLKLDSMARAATHYKKLHNQKGYLRCCGRRFTQRYRLIDHINTHLNITYVCQVCGKRFDTKQYLRNHMVHHEDDKQFCCDKCGKSFAKKFMIKNHMQSVHAFDNVEPTFACHYEGCEKVYVNGVRLKHHIKYAHENRDKEICEICSKTFSLKNSLEEHIKIHTRRPEDRFKCDICGHYIGDKKTFVKHVKNHETEALDNTCHYCGKRSPNLNALRRHIRYVHETVPTHQCRFCEKAFKRPRDLKDHEAAIHTHQELYECSFCPKTFRNQSNMLSHRKKEHPEHYVKPAYMRELGEGEMIRTEIVHVSESIG